ncbi:MAG: hypothetical protein G01um101470_138 [Parcubacteria group bacterium Gr01-1014_70]|nr:MAG: hypothetical protein G01um101470_138 [Parcubacteria group bacterium Gr01-1014_70]
MAKYKPLVLTEAEQKIVDTLKLHTRDMFPTAKPAGHDWQHLDSQMTLWQHVGGSVMQEPQFIVDVDPMVPFIVAVGHDLNRLPIFMPKSKAEPDFKEYNDRAKMHLLSFFYGFLCQLGIPIHLRNRAMKVIEGIRYQDMVVCDDLDKAITGYFYAWRCAAVGAGQRVKVDVVKNYLIAKTGGDSARLVADEKLESWLDDLEWAEDWDPCAAEPPQKFVIRSAVLHEIADPGFQTLRRTYADTVKQLRMIGYDITVPEKTAERLRKFGFNV